VGNPPGSFYMKIAQIILEPYDFSPRVGEVSKIQRCWTLSICLKFGLPTLGLHEGCRIKEGGAEDYGDWEQHHGSYFEVGLEWKWGWSTDHSYYDGYWYMVKRGPLVVRWHC